MTISKASVHFLYFNFWESQNSLKNFGTPHTALILRYLSRWYQEGSFEPKILPMGWTTHWYTRPLFSPLFQIIVKFRHIGEEPCGKEGGETRQGQHRDPGQGQRHDQGQGWKGQGGPESNKGKLKDNSFTVKAL